MKNEKKVKVFLGGTCNLSLWREKLIPMIKVDYFNPVVKNWTPECQAEEIRQRKKCDFCLYVITPKMMGVYSIAEVVDDSNKKPKQTLFCVLENDGRDKFSAAQIKSLQQVKKMVEKNGAKCFESLLGISTFLNKQ